MDDLHKEYEAIFPGLSTVTGAFAGQDPECTAGEAAALVAEVARAPQGEPAALQHLEIIEDRSALVRSLYSVGFLGLRDAATGTYGYCHDGRTPNQRIGETDRLLIHPCYWVALGGPRRVLADTEAEEIFDEYEIHIASQTPEIRKAQLGQQIAELTGIPVAAAGAAQFEEWCLKSARILFAGQLSNFELHPNGNAVQRRDVVASNVAMKGFWRRLYEDYRCRQVIFEVKNKEGLGADEYRQALSYLTGEYGRCGFIITRDESCELNRGQELDWVREIHDKHGGVLIVKLTGTFLAGLLSKLRNPQRHDEANVRLNKLLDTYTRLYLAGRMPTARGRGSGRRRKKHRGV